MGKLLNEDFHRRYAGATPGPPGVGAAPSRPPAPAGQPKQGMVGPALPQGVPNRTAQRPPQMRGVSTPPAMGRSAVGIPNETTQPPAPISRPPVMGNRMAPSALYAGKKCDDHEEYAGEMTHQPHVKGRDAGGGSHVSAKIHAEGETDGTKPDVKLHRSYAGEHPGFKAVQSKIASKEGVSKDSAGAILASASRGASAGAKKANPNLNKVKG